VLATRKSHRKHPHKPAPRKSESLQSDPSGNFGPS